MFQPYTGGITDTPAIPPHDRVAVATVARNLNPEFDELLADDISRDNHVEAICVASSMYP